MSTIAIIGTGYVGLTTGAYLAHLGHEVTCADIFEEKVARLNKGEVPILEAGLDELVTEGLAADRLRFVVGAVPAVEDAEFVFLCVQTPQGDNGSADLTYIREAAAEIGPHLEAESVVINKSTVPVGSTRVVEQALGRDDVFVVSNPEFLREGSAVHDCLHPDRIVIGSEDQAAAMRVASLFESLKAPLVITDPASAETIKYASNAFLATKVSYVNALANVCEAVGADVREVVLGMGYDKRIGFEFLKPGPGWGGSCFVGTETVLARRGDDLRLWTFEDLFAEVETRGADGWEVLSWRSGEPTPELLPVTCFTARPYDGDVIDVRTKMGRRLTVTADHPMITGPAAATGDRVEDVSVVLAGDLTTDDWLPVAQGFPLLPEQCGEGGVSQWPRTVVEKMERILRLAANAGGWRATVDREGLLLTTSAGGGDVISRLLGDLGLVVEVQRESDTATIGLDAAQLHDVPWLTGVAVTASRAHQAQRIAPTGYRRLSKNAAWVRVTEAARRPFCGTVHSLEVPDAHTVVTSFGLVAHNCFPKDTRAMVHIAEEHGYDFGLLKGVITVNDEQYERMATKVERMLDGSLDGALVAAWGLTFKARTDDLRDSPAIEVIRRLQERGATVKAYDPAVPEARPGLEGIQVVDDPYSVCEGADVLVVLTEWDEFRWLDFAKIAGLM
ncbi:MAG: nucleotide sugar dehydrogenase, partial [Acidimicrobiales bacterium]